MFNVLAAVVVSGICLVIGGAIALGGLERRRVARQFTQTPTTKTHEITATDQPVALYGTAEPHPDYEPLDAPFSDDECLYKQWEVKEKRYHGGRKTKSWRTVAEGTDHVPFRLRDGRDAIDVATGEFDTFLLDTTKDPGQSSRFGTPDDVADFVAEHVGEHRTDSGLFSRSRKFKQVLIQPGDEVYVYGRPVPAGDEFFDRYVLTGFDDDSEYAGVISDYSPRRLRLQALTGWARILYGAVFALAGSFVALAFLLDLPMATATLLVFAGVVGLGAVCLLADGVRRTLKQFYYARLAA